MIRASASVSLIGIVHRCWLLMMTGMPLGVVTLIVSCRAPAVLRTERAVSGFDQRLSACWRNIPLVAVPLFVLMASILEKAGIAEDLFDAMSIFAGNLRGGVAVQTVAVAVVLAAMSGVMGGEIVMLGLVALPQMLRLGYNRQASHRRDLCRRLAGHADPALDRHDRLRPLAPTSPSATCSSPEPCRDRCWRLLRDLRPGPLLLQPIPRAHRRGSRRDQGRADRDDPRETSRSRYCASC